MNIKGLTKRTKDKREADIVYLSKKPIRELWDKAAIIKSQQRHVFELYVKATKTRQHILTLLYCCIIVGGDLLEAQSQFSEKDLATDRLDEH